MATLRCAHADDRALLHAWNSQAHVADAAGIWDWDAELEGLRDGVAPWRELFIYEAQGRPLGFVQILDPELEPTRYWGDLCHARALDLWIGPEDQLRRGHGSKLLELALARCFADPRVDHVWVDPLASNVRARAFFEKHGFTFVEQRVMDGDDTAVYVLARP